MIYEFAVSPELFSDISEIKFLFQSFGFEEGRLISDIPKNEWKRAVQKAIKNSGQKEVRRKYMKEAAFKLFRKASYKRNQQPEQCGQNWIDYVMSAHEERPFRAVILDSNSPEPHDNVFINSEFDLFDNELWNVPKDIIIERQAKKMIDAIKPFIDCSNEIILVDRNFKPEERRFNNVLRELIDVVENRPFSPKINKLTFHVGDQYEKVMERNCQRHILDLLPTNFKFEIVVWPKNDLHDRFILSNIGGVSFGQGLDEFNGYGPKDVRVNILSAESYKNWFGKCKSKSPAFTMVGS